METNDKLNETIAQRLGENRRKLEFIEGQKAVQKPAAKKLSFRRLTYWAAALAACVAVALFVSPAVTHRSDISGIGVSSVDFTEYRGGSAYTEMRNMIAAGRYADALPFVENELQESNKLIADLRTMLGDAADDEESKYQLSVEADFNQQLRWQKIGLLVKLNRRADAVAELEQYISLRPDGDRQDEAEELLGKIK